MKLLKAFNYILLANFFCGLGFVLTSAVWLQSFNLTITIQTVISLALFMVFVQLENKLNSKKVVS